MIHQLSVLVSFVLISYSLVDGYYTRKRCYATGDCIITTPYLGGGFEDEYHAWIVECSDGEAMTGIYDYNDFQTISQVWCTFTFPLKPPSQGLYPYYELCNVRNFTTDEYYCYDKYYPVDTVNTFVTGVYADRSEILYIPSLMKCCKTPPNYQLDYRRCQWKYTHDKSGEHYDNVWLVKCDTNYIMTGLGTAINPWDNNPHFTWIQCCPIVMIPKTSLLTG